MSRQLKEVLSWRLVTELWRRRPNTFLLLETHPGGGTYDCLTLLDRRSASSARSLYINREGSVTATAKSGKSRFWPDWVERMLIASPDGLLKEVSTALGLPTSGRLPPSIPATLVFRFVSDFLTHSLGHRVQWECRNGFLDTSGYGGGRREEWFSQFSKIGTRPRPQKMASDSSWADAYYYWFLVCDGEPKLCLSTDGNAFKRSGEVFDLALLYQAKRRIWPLITTVALDLLP